MMKNFLKVPLITLVVLLAAVALFIVDHFSLSAYFMLTAFYLLCVNKLCSSLNPEDTTHQRAITAYFGVSVLSLLVFYNYYQARDDVYGNLEHHALEWKGYQLPESGLLYGQSADAFLQDTASQGTLRYELQRGDTGQVVAIRLTAHGLRRSFFAGSRGASDGVAPGYQNKNTTLPVVPAEGICFENRDDSTRLRLQITELPQTTLWPMGGPVRDSVSYIFTVTDWAGDLLCADTVTGTLLIQKSYELSALIPIRTVSAFGSNLSHYNIVRQRYRPAEGPYTWSNYGWLKRALVYMATRWPFEKDFGTFRDQPYLVEQTSPDAAVSIVGDSQTDHFFEALLQPGDPFFLGFGQGSTPRMYFSKNGQLRFDLPQWRPLTAEGEQTRMLVSSSNHVVCNPDEVSPCNLLFQAPQADASDSDEGYQGNNHLFTTHVAYAKGPTQEQLRLRIDQGRVVRAGEEFLVDCKADSQAKAVLQLTDFKQQSCFQPWPLLRTILIFFLIASLSILVSLFIKREYVMPVNVEMACMVLLMVLFTTRYVLCWRMSVFPPMDDLSRFEYDSFVNSRSVLRHLTVGMPCALLLFLPVMKFLALAYRIWQAKAAPKPSPASGEPRRWWLLWLPVLAVLVEMVSCQLLPRGFQILLPVAVYFLLDLLLSNFINDEPYDGLQARYGLDYGFTFPFVLNYIAHLGLLTMLDAGFGVMFLLFGIVRYYLMFCRYYAHRDKSSHQWKWWVLTVAGLVFILAAFYFSTHIVAAMMNSEPLGVAVLTVVAALVLMLFVWGIDLSAGRQWLKKPASIGASVAGCLLAGWLVAMPAYDYVLGPDGHYAHMRYRTKVLVEDWKDILNNERVSNASNVQRFRQTSENQWILDHYYNNRPKGQERYFQMQPMSRTGAMWGAQTTDLSFLRFGIGEHGMSFAVGLLLLMLLVYAITLRQPHEQAARREARRNIATGALLLILMQGIFVWMSVTNKFIFFGQDFPMLSMTSKMTIYYVLFLLLVACLFSVPRPAESARNPVYNEAEKWLASIFTVTLALFCVFLHCVQGNDRKNRDEESYSLELNSVKKVLHAHNSLLSYYQLRSNLAYNQLVLSTGGGYNLYGQKLFRDFNDNVYLNLDDEHEGMASPDCLVLLGGDEQEAAKLPLLTASSNLYQPLVDFAQMRRRPASARMEMSPDSVTLQFRFPADSLYTPGERALIQNINQLFVSYQIENRSLYLATLYVNSKGKEALRHAQAESRATLAESRSRLNSSDFTGMMLDYQAFLDSARQHRGQPGNVTLDSLLARIDDIDHAQGATFTNSLIEAYMKNYAKSNSPGNIVYMRRDRATSYLQFHINDRFFEIGGGQRLWRGDVVASDAGQGDLLLKGSGSDRRRIYGQHESNAHFDVACIPSSWLQGEKDQYLFQAHQPVGLQLKSETPISLPYHQWSALRLSNTDGAKIIETGGRVGLRLPDDLHNVFAKNIMVNGKRRLVYRLGKRLFWMKPYSDYVSSVMADSIGPEREHPEAMALNHIVSLDYGLSDTLYQLLDSVGSHIYRNENRSDMKEANLSVFVGNSDGEILAMPEYNGKAMFRVNPNDQLAISRFELQSNLFSDYTDERNLHGNQNLLSLMIGPGSSLKPLTFGAVSSTYATHWDRFQLVGLGTYAVNHYAERDFNRKETFISLHSDEPEFGATFSVADYLRRSSNYFNSAMVFIGMFGEASLHDGIFAPASSPLREREFPVMSVDGRRVKFGTIFRPHDVDAQPILLKRFQDNYGVYGVPTLIDSTYLDQNSLAPALRAYSRQLARSKGNKNKWLWKNEAWSVAEPSFIDFPLWADDDQLSYAQKIKTLTLGMRRVVSISPLKMAEMFSRMFLLDNRFHFTVSRPAPYAPSVNYVVPAFGGEPARYLAMLQSERGFFQGMSECPRTGGTANYLDGVDRRLQAHGLFVYAKTGTIDTNNKNQANLLAVVITNADMRRVTISGNRMVTPDGQPLKFYVVYIAQDKTLRLTESKSIKNTYQRRVVETVVSSWRFRKFFGLQQTNQTSI